jgi:Ser/Thr protein kinase RdoA (MazF antagonist)
VTADDGTAAIRDVLACYGIEGTSVRPIAGGRANRHWRVDAGADEFVLREYNALRTPAAIAYEHEMLAHVDARGWPVAPPLRADGGSTTITAHGRTYALFPSLPGAPGAYYDDERRRAKGALLARLHRDMASSPMREQREGFGRIWELDLLTAGTPHATFNDMLRAFGQEHRELASAVRSERYRSLRELSRLGYGDEPDVFVHADFHNENLLFDGDRLTAVLDFDEVHRDARAVDLACSIVNDCAEPPADIATDPRATAAFVAGYAAESPLTDAELRLIVPLMRAYHVWLLAYTLRRWALGDGRADAVARIERRVGERMPQLQARAGEIEAAVLEAGEG